MKKTMWGFQNIVNGLKWQIVEILLSFCKTEGYKFRRIFVWYEATAGGSEFCCPLLSLNGTHLKSKYHSILLGAAYIYAKSSLFPFASGIVDIENNDNWYWMDLISSISVSRILQNSDQNSIENMI